VQRFEKFEFENLDELRKIGGEMPVVRKFPLGAELQFANVRDFAIVGNEDRIWQVASAGYSLVQHETVINSVVQEMATLGLEGLKGHVDTWNHGGRMWVKFITGKTFEPFAGDKFNHGIWFANSYDGSTAVQGGYYAWRQVCSNGMMGWAREIAARQIHLGIKGISEWIREAIGKIRANEETFERLIQQAAQVRLSEDLEIVLKRLSVGPKTIEKLEKRLENYQNVTAYDVANAITAYATHDLKERPVAAQDYNRLAQRILLKPEILCVVPAK